MTQSKFAPCRVRAALRHNEALRLRTQGLSFRQIGERLGCSKCRARQIIEEEVGKVRDGSHDMVQVLREQMLADLAHLRTVVKSRLMDGEDTLKTIETYLKVMDRQAKLMGLDAPSKSISVTGNLADLSEAELEERARYYGIVIDQSPPQKLTSVTGETHAPVSE